MTKFFQVEMPDGSKWRVPAEIIARSRANYYEKKEPGCYQNEFDYTYGDDSELIDWATNNMNWSDVKDFAVKVEEKPALSEGDFQEGWCSGEHEIVEA